MEIAENGQAAMAMARLHPYDVILMDIQMPIMDGIEAIRILREQGWQKPAVALTAHALKEELDHCLAAGFNDHVSKPINVKMLIEKIKTLRSFPFRTSRDTPSPMS